MCAQQQKLMREEIPVSDSQEAAGCYTFRYTNRFLRETRP
jgi:hypothetical protein